MSWLDKRKDVGTGDFGEPIPEGDYVLEIVKAELKPNNNKDGRVLHLDQVVVSDFHNGRHVFERWNVENPNPTAERIGLERVNQIIEFSGMDGEPSSEQDLVGLVIGARVKVREDEGYDPSNEVSYYKSPDSCKLDETESNAKSAKKPAGSSFKEKAGAGKAGEEKSEPADTAAEKPAKKPWEK